MFFESVSGVLKGASFLTNYILKISRSLWYGKTPSEWQDIWEGPTDPLAYLKAVSSRYGLISEIRAKNSIFDSPMTLSSVFRPKTLLNAFRQKVCRQCNYLMLICS